jgi:hypothetical protein
MKAAAFADSSIYLFSMFYDGWVPLFCDGKKGSLVQVVVLAACESRGHKFERWPLHIARCVGKNSH